jgi:hypothetical protein
MIKVGRIRAIVAVVVVMALVFVSLSILFFGEPTPVFPADRF